MLGSGLQFTRHRGEDRFYDAGKARRAHRLQQTDSQLLLRRAKSDVTTGRSIPVKDKVENRTGMELSKPVVEPQLSNLQRFLESITPSVPAQYLSKTTMRGLRTCDVEFQPYFELSDLWESFKEWSAYGAGVPLILNDSDSVVQYYVPYLSAIQIYGDATRTCLRSRQPRDDSDSDYRDSSSEGSSDCELDRGFKSSRIIRSELPVVIDRLSLRDHHIPQQEESSSDEGESMQSRGVLLFEYLERDQPYTREPLADKIMDLSHRFPDLKSLKSCDLLSSSWISIAWYPIYRIPTGPTLKDLDACFLTYHYLHTPLGAPLAATPRTPGTVVYPSEVDGLPKVPLPAFGLASYKLKESLWCPNGSCDHQLATGLFQAADSWLRHRKVGHPDFQFFCRR